MARSNAQSTARGRSGLWQREPRGTAGRLRPSRQSSSPVFVRLLTVDDSDSPGASPVFGGVLQFASSTSLARVALEQSVRDPKGARGARTERQEAGVHTGSAQTLALIRESASPAAPRRSCHEVGFAPLRDSARQSVPDSERFRAVRQRSESEHFQRTPISRARRAASNPASGAC
jgi:hypothetical protein